MFPILEAEFLAPDIKRFIVQAPRIAKKRQAGQFVIVRVHEHGERIPLTIADGDPQQGTITINVQGIGKTTRLLNALQAGDSILDVVGPLGKPSHVERFGTVVVIGGGGKRGILDHAARCAARLRRGTGRGFACSLAQQYEQYL